MTELNLTDPELLKDPISGYDRARETSPVVRLVTPGFGAMWGITRHADARAALTDPRLAPSSESFMRMAVPEHCRKYLRTMQEQDGPEHRRLRGLARPAFTPRRAEDLRPRIAPLIDRLLDELPGHAEDGVVDLRRFFAQPLPMDVICELAGVPAEDRDRWRAHGAVILSGDGRALMAAVPEMIDDAIRAVGDGRPGDDLIGMLAVAQGDRLSEDELVTLVWHLILAGQVPANLIANSMATLLAEPELVATLRAEPALLPGAVEELTRWQPPQMFTIPRFASEEIEVGGVRIPKGEPVTVVLPAASRDPRAFTDPARLDLRRAEGAHLGYGHGPHFCLGAPLARVQTEMALAALLDRFPRMRLAVDPAELPWVPDPSTRRLSSLPVRW
ncbi:cytochrome P450 family protein [Catenuloplanes atrovinosus]|uniref:Cytochrome P450 n=1 Tax=Catenuloplanes atrovinosus TaxID=137266 RepID=A0AAE3YU00_9ACTN|nr:cytochrome P450 [Catenuloplanes atrovinosus]MDR7278373.1 cytochrome P450 [Catenuloplanes atrovinosus]